MTIEQRARVKSFAAYASIVLIPAILFSCVLALVTVEGNSMAPNVYSGSLLLCNRHGDISIGDIVVFKAPDGTILVKRVAGTAGDTVSVHNGICTRNGRMEPSSNYSLDSGTGDEFEQAVVPERHIFVLGDNRGVSLDSRDMSVGWVDLSSIIGTMTLKLK